MISALCNNIFEKCIIDYHLTDDTDAAISNPYPKEKLEYLLYLKCWIDLIQWHLEDKIRHPSIDPVKGLALKRRIDALNQERTDTVELIDGSFAGQFRNTAPGEGAVINTESPAWAIDRLSILALKIYHMQAETNRSNTSEEHRASCRQKLDILLEQQKDLSAAIDDLLSDIAQGKKYMKVYKQMKMYNDPALNPVLYQQ